MYYYNDKIVTLFFGIGVIIGYTMGRTECKRPIPAFNEKRNRFLERKNIFQSEQNPSSKFDTINDKLFSPSICTDSNK